MAGEKAPKVGLRHLRAECAVVLALAPSFAALLVALLVFGAGQSVVDVAMNLSGAANERALGRTILPLFHASFSVGTVLGAGLGSLTLALLEPRFGSSDAALLAMLILAAAWLGSAAGRMVQSKLGMFVLSVLGGVLVAAGTVGGTMGIEELVVGHHPVASGRLMFSFVLVFTHLLLLGVSLADRRSPAQVER